MGYIYSIPLDTNIDFKNKRTLDSAIEDLKQQLRLTGLFVRWHPYHTEHLRCIVLNLYRCFTIDPSMYVAYSRNRNSYFGTTRYKSMALKPDATGKIIDILSCNLGYLSTKTGFYDRKKKKGRLSRMRATSKLIELLTDKHGMCSLDICRNQKEETIILRDNNKNKIDYTDTLQTTHWRENLKIINDNIAGTFVGLYVTDESLKKIREELKVDSRHSKEHSECNYIDLSRTRLVRIFNGDFRHGGRFYGGWWEEIPKQYRKSIVIDSRETCEVDFCGYHISMLYAMERLPIPVDDVYSLDGIPDEARDAIKLAVQILLNTSSEKKALRAFERNFPISEHISIFRGMKVTHEKIIEALLKKHAAIAHHFYNPKKGRLLQHLDSLLAQKILLDLAAKGIVALPIHDSFIVQRIHRKELVSTMNKVCRKYLKQDLKLKEASSGGTLEMGQSRELYAEYYSRKEAFAES